MTASATSSSQKVDQTDRSSRGGVVRGPALQVGSHRSIGENHSLGGVFWGPDIYDTINVYITKSKL